MPITLSEITVPFNASRREDGSIDHTCSLCDEVVGYDYHIQPEPHTLDECLKRLKDKIEELTRAKDAN